MRRGGSPYNALSEGCSFRLSRSAASSLGSKEPRIVAFEQYGRGLEGPRAAQHISSPLVRPRAGQPLVLPHPNFTASQISPLRPCWHCSLTARASPEVLGEGDDQPSAHSGDRIWNVALGSQRRRRGVGDRRERQVLRTAWRDEILRGGIVSPIRGLRNVRARPPP